MATSTTAGDERGDVGTEPGSTEGLDAAPAGDDERLLRRGEPVIPVGAIIAWHRDLLGEDPGVPYGWALCDGGHVEDPESPIDGKVLPDLNGERRFLRGSETSGGQEADAFQGHWHHVNYDFGQRTGSTYQRWVSMDHHGMPPGTTFPSAAIFTATWPKTDPGRGAVRVADETRPANMSVVWIMKVK